jgi:hypothetical protein
MPDSEGRLFVSDIAARFGITESDWRARVSRGYAPASSGLAVVDGAIRAVWHPEVIDQYAEERADRLASREGVTRD